MSTELKLIEIKDKKQLNDFVGAQSHAEFLQSWEWGDFQEKAEGKVMRFVIEDKDVIFAAATLVKKSLPLGMNYFYCPRGIIINEELNINNENLYDFFFGEIKKIAAQEKVIFLRFEPRKIDIDSGREKTKDEIRNTIDIQPSKTIMLDLSKSESVLLATMHQKTRYNIRLAEKKGVKIREAENSPLERGGAAAATGCVIFAITQQLIKTLFQLFFLRLNPALRQRRPTQNTNGIFHRFLFFAG